MSNDGGPAFPIAEYDLKNGHHDGRYEVLRQASGISVRDYFAAKAMAAIISKCELQECDADDDCVMEQEVATGAYSYADAMLAERNKTDPEQEAVEVPQ